jgi:DNA-binding transcriptional ArsR family regulator
MNAIALLLSDIDTPCDARKRIENILEHHIKDLNAMEVQFAIGENIELPRQTLDRWLKALVEQRALVKALKTEFPGMLF